MKIGKREKRFLIFLLAFCVAYVSYIIIERLVISQKRIREEISDALWMIKKNEGILALKDRYNNVKNTAESSLKGVGKLTAR